MAIPHLPDKKYIGKRTLPLIPTGDPVARYEHQRHAVHSIETSYENANGGTAQSNTFASPGELSWKPLCWHSWACRQYGMTTITRYHDGSDWHTLTFAHAVDTEYWTKAEGWMPAYHAMKEAQVAGKGDPEITGLSRRYRERHQRALKGEA